VSGIPRTIWKYNARYHLALEHGAIDGFQDELSESLQHCRDQFIIDIQISKAEEKDMRIPETNTAEYRRRYNVPETDSLQDMINENRKM
jgi:hypothetical protein